jgi:hypothetical protein
VSLSVVGGDCWFRLLVGLVGVIGWLAVFGFGWVWFALAHTISPQPTRTTLPAPPPAPRSCPTNAAGQVVVPAGSAAKPSNISCRYTIVSSTGDAGVLTAVAQIAGESKKSGAAANASAAASANASLAAPTAAPAAPQTLSFTGPAVAKRGAGECATLAGVFAPAAAAGGGVNASAANVSAAANATDPTVAKAAAAAAAAAGTTLLIAPNGTGDGAPPASGGALRLCQAQQNVTFKANFTGLTSKLCNRYLVGGFDLVINSVQLLCNSMSTYTLRYKTTILLSLKTS